MNTTCIELVVGGKIVDLNRIPLPADTPIIDERFERGATNRSESRTERSAVQPQRYCWQTVVTPRLR